MATRKTCLLALLLCICLLLPSCGGGETAEAPTQPANLETPGAEDTLVIAVPDDVEGLDVQQISLTNVVHDLTYEPLVVYNAERTKVFPAFAESFEATDKYIEFVLPAGAKFSNGETLDARALKASTERYLLLSDYAGDLDAVSGVEIIDERTVRYNLSGPAAYIWCALTDKFQGVVDVAAAHAMGDDAFNENPVSNGPYYVEEWVKGSHVTLKRNEYFQTNNPNIENHGVANFGTVEVRIIPNEQDRLDALRNGEVDVIYDVPSERCAELKADPGITVYQHMLPGVAFLNLQTDTGLLIDPAVRQALTYAVDRDAFSKALGDRIVTRYGLLTEGQTGYSAEEEARLAEKLRYDPERARSILAEDGWADSNGDGVLERGGQNLRIEMLIPSDIATFRAVGPILREQFAEIGVDAQINEQTADVIKSLMKQDSFDIGARQYEWADADMLYYMFTSESGYLWDDPALTVALLVAREENDPERRVAAYETASEILANDFKAIPLYAESSVFAAKANILGIRVSQSGERRFNDATRS